MNMAACLGYQNTVTNHRVNDSDDDPSNKHVRNSFFHGKGYRHIIQCLNNGYEVSTDLIEYMEDYNNLLKSQIDQLNAYSKKWRGKIENQSRLASYNTTQLVQIKTVSSPEEHAELIPIRCNAIQEVISTYKRQVDRMYPKGRLGFVHKHYRSEEMEAKFKDAYSDRQKVVDKLQRLRNDEKTADIAVLEAKDKLKSLEFNETTNKNELSKAESRLEKKKSKLDVIRTRITKTKEEYKEAKETYRRKATKIYGECRDLEQERLDQIRETLIAFSRAMHSTEYSNKQNTLYGKLVLEIESEQKTRVDLEYWAQTYHVISLPQRTLSETGENEEFHSVTDQPTTTQSKRKSNLKRSNTNEPKTPQ